MVVGKQRRIRSAEKFKIYDNAFQLAKYSVSKLKKRMEKIQNTANILEKKWRDGKIKTLPYQNRLGGLRDAFYDTQRAIGIKGLPKMMKKFSITLKGGK
jgi:hypothetical protein